MISKRNLFTILTVMAIVFAIFQFSQVARSTSNNYELNQYQDLQLPENNEWKPQTINLSALTEEDDIKYTLFVGDKTSDVGSIVKQWGTYSKRNIVAIKDLDTFDINVVPNPEFVIVDSNYIDFDNQTDDLTDIVNLGVSIVFCNLPEPSVIAENEELKTLIGVTEVREEATETDGYHLFSGFLLGGEIIYQPKKAEEEKRQDLDLTIPWYILGGGTKTYMVGIKDSYMEEYEYRNSYLPAVIWRNSLGEGQVFCVNGDYMSKTSGLGILSSMIFELSSYQIYPVVNAQNTLVVDYPLVANENADYMQKTYSRSAESFQTEVVWPTLVRLMDVNRIKYTCLVSPKYNYEDTALPNHDLYSQYLSLFNEKSAETGASLQHADGISIADKVTYDQEFYDEEGTKYAMTSAFMNIEEIDDVDVALSATYMKDVRTIATSEDVQVPILSYVNDNVTMQSLTSNTKDFYYSMDLMLKSVETALGYDNAELNIGEVIWADDADDQWEVVYNDMSSALSTYWRQYRVFDQTTLTESDARVRTFLNISYDVKEKDNKIKLTVNGRENSTCYFILRTHGSEISAIKGATYEKIEDDAYLLKIDSDEVVIKLTSAHKEAEIE